ncbi:MAG TPA: transposase, partial [Chloroflexota bacterium]|nr:transposase [Chloroflexota bacterium]
MAQLAQAHLDADLVVRLAKNRVFRRAPGPYSGRGRPHKHGSVFKLKDARTHGRPDRSASLEHPAYGMVTVDAWTELHVQDAANAPFTVVRVQVEHLPRHGRPSPLWLAWIGGELPNDLHQVWRWYLRRFTVEHAFRFAKQSLGWTTVRPRHPAAADRWTWLLAAVFWQLWLARPVVADQRLPWERPRPPERLTPGRV